MNNYSKPDTMLSDSKKRKKINIEFNWIIYKNEFNWIKKFFYATIKLDLN